MNRLRVALSTAFLILLVFSCEKRICGCDFPPSPLLGDWTLISITNGLTQKIVTAAEAGYTETLSFDGLVEGGMYQQVRNGLPVQTSHYALSFPKGGSTEGMIYFVKDATQQSFRLAGNKLYVSERGPRALVLADGPHEVTIIDGSTYEYQRQ